MDYSEKDSNTTALQTCNEYDKENQLYKQWAPENENKKCNHFKELLKAVVMGQHAKHSKGRRDWLQAAKSEITRCSTKHNSPCTQPTISGGIWRYTEYLIWNYPNNEEIQLLILESKFEQ